RGLDGLDRSAGRHLPWRLARAVQLGPRRAGNGRAVFDDRGAGLRLLRPGPRPVLRVAGRGAPALAAHGSIHTAADRRCRGMAGDLLAGWRTDGAVRRHRPLHGRLRSDGGHGGPTRCLAMTRRSRMAARNDTEVAMFKTRSGWVLAGFLLLAAVLSSPPSGHAGDPPPIMRDLELEALEEAVRWPNASVQTTVTLAGAFHRCPCARE